MFVKTNHEITKLNSPTHEIRESRKIAQAYFSDKNEFREGGSVGPFSNGEDLLFLSSSTSMSLRVKCFVHYMLLDNVKFIKLQL